MTVLEYFETTCRPRVDVTIAGHGKLYCRPQLLFNEKGRPVGVIINNQLISEENINIEVRK